jgi:hypothetical protein
MPRARVLVVLAGALSAISPWVAAPALAQDGAEASEPRDLIVLSGDVRVHRGEEVGEVVLLHGRVDVAGVVRGDVVVIDGRIDVTGQVSGTVVSLNGPISIGPNAQVLGDLIGRDRIRVAEGAQIGGRVREGAAFTFRTPLDLFGPLAAWSAVAASALVLGVLVLLLAPRGAEAAALAARDAPFRSALAGLAAAVALPALGILGVVSLLGLPFGLALLLALLLVFSIGFTLSAFALGRAIWRLPRSRWLAFPIGWAIVAALAAIPIAGGAVWFFGAVYGTGSMAVGTWRARGTRGRHRPSGRIAREEEVLAILEPEPTEPEPMIREPAMEEEGTGI